MQIKSFTGAAVLLALAPQAVLAGTATVVNQCGYPIYYAVVSQGVGAAMNELQGSFSMPYMGDGDGVSIKLSTADTLSGPVSQFEFTSGNGHISYDFSNIDGYPLAAGGVIINPSMQGDPNNPTCVPVDCPAGQSVCTAAYNAPNDIRTMVCDQASDLVLTICPGGPSKREEPTTKAQVKREEMTWSGFFNSRMHPRQLPKRS